MLLLLLSWLWPAGLVHAQRDFAPDNTEWNGLSELLEVAEEEELPVEVVDRLDIGTVDANVALLVVGPVHEPPLEHGLSDLLRAGARIAIADDYGAAGSMMRTFHIDRHEPSGNRELALRGNDALLIARPNGSHLLSARVDALVTNHPMAIHHEELEPIFSFGPSDALVLAGAVGTGRLVVISDPSVLINNMLELGGNRRFAANLLRYLASPADGAPRRLILVPPEAPIVGRFGEPGADRPLHDVRSFLERLGQVEIPGVGLRVLGLALILIFALFASGMLPRKSPYGAHAMFLPAVTYGGMAGRMGWYARTHANLLDPLLTYQFELETELGRRLSLTALDGPAVLRELSRQGVDPAAARSLVSLLDELRTLADRAERGTVDPVTLGQLKDAMRRGDAVLATLRRAPGRSA